MTVGERIRKKRQELGWTQEILCSKVGLSKSFLSELESGKRNVSAENLYSIAQVFGVSLDFLMAGKASKESRDPNFQVPIPSSLARFAEKEHLSFKKTLTLFNMYRQIVATRAGRTKDLGEKLDWKKFYNGVKEFMDKE
ncbi:MAG: helix-turn-helix domain-containing protein [Pirellula sp.]|jgi:transcriptional regulator with XRE-family HTH domain